MLHLLFYPDKSQVCYCDFTAGFLISFLLISNEICAHCETEQQKKSSGIRFSQFVNCYFFHQLVLRMKPETESIRRLFTPPAPANHDDCKLLIEGKYLIQIITLKRLSVQYLLNGMKIKEMPGNEATTTLMYLC